MQSFEPSVREHKTSTKEPEKVGLGPLPN